MTDEDTPSVVMRLVRDILGGAPVYDVAVRAARTALQTFVGTIVAAPLLDLDVSALAAAGLAAATSALAVIHGYLTPPQPQS